MEPIIKVRNLTKTYKMYEKPIDRLKEALFPFKKNYSKGFNALEGVTFDIYKGENIGIIGVNGSGKSTLLKIITGVLNPTEGSVDVNGKVSALLELGAGFNMEYTGLENIYLNGTMMGYTKEEMDAKVNDITEFAGIGDFINHPVKTYSSGMFARLAFAVAINVEPEILIVDEALSVGDMRFQMKCMNKMKQMMQGGTTVLFVSHDINAIRRFCTKAIWLNKGVVQQIGEVNSVADDYLDFLKFGETFERTEKFDAEGLPEFEKGDNIAQIISFKVLNNHEQECLEMELDEPITIEVIYDVYEENIESPVLGIAILGMDDDYVCGLNTLLDRVKISWKYGRNRMCLHYPHGIRAIGGKYYFIVALMDETATVDIHSVPMVKEFSIKTGYVGEGRFIIPHEWSR